jgi:hypothetical protein
MQKYPEVGEQVRVKNETGLHTITRTWKEHGRPRWQLSDGRIFWNLDALVTTHQKYITVYVIQQHYGDGWEDVTEEETRAAGIQARKDYRSNTPHPTRLIRRKELNPLYQK